MNQKRIKFSGFAFLFEPIKFTVVLLIISLSNFAQGGEVCPGFYRNDTNAYLRRAVITAFGTRIESELDREIGRLRKYPAQLKIDPIVSRTNGKVLEIDKLTDQLEELESSFTGHEETYEVQGAANLAFQIQYANQVKKELDARPKMRELAEFTNEILQSPGMVKDFAIELILKSLLAVKEKNDPDKMQFIDLVFAEPGRWGSIWSSSEVRSEIVSIALEAGWQGIVDVEEKNFFDISIKQRKLPRDTVNRNTPHTEDAHLFQLVFVSKLLVKRFGPERAWEFIQFLASPDGSGLWYFLFDRGPGHTRDFRGPRFFYKNESGLERFIDL